MYKLSDDTNLYYNELHFYNPLILSHAISDRKFVSLNYNEILRNLRYFQITR